MTYDTFSTHAPTGYPPYSVVSANVYSTEGRNIGYPSRFSVYVKKIAESDGSQSITESRTTSDLVGNRLYLYHRPLIGVDGSPTSISIGGGGSPAIDLAQTNAKQGYIVFTTLPTSNFTVSYLASPDCISSWHFNVLQDDVMEVQRILGPSTLTGYPGLRNLSYGIFDAPNSAVVTSNAVRAVFLSDLDQNIRISSSTDGTLAATRGTRHTIQLGYQTDAVICDVTGFTVKQSVGTSNTRIVLGTTTGDRITYMGSLSGEGPLIIGGPAWTGYSGKVFTTGLTGSFYSGAMLRVHGDVAVMGSIKSIGPITIVTTTGTSSQVLGDWVVGDELFVYGVSHLIGNTETNVLTAKENIYLDKDIVANNYAGAGGNGQSLVDGLDCSEVAYSYATLTKKALSYSVIGGSIDTTVTAPKLVTWGAHRMFSGNTVGEVLAMSGVVHAPAGPSGAHPCIIQLDTAWPVVGSTFGSTGSFSGYWSPGMMDPGNLWVKITAGQGAGFSSPIYGYTIETGNTSSILGINVFCPELIEPRPTTNDTAIVFNPHAVPYKFISAAGGAVPQFNIEVTTDPLEISFSDQVRIIRSSTSSQSMSTALEQSISGQAGTIQTGVAFILADLTGTDPEINPIFKARPVPFHLPTQTLLGEIVASKAGGTWTILDTVSYRPHGIYDSGWIPVATGYVTCSGRYIKGNGTQPIRVYFQHQLGADADLARTSMDLYLAAKHTGTISLYNETHAPMWGMFGQDCRASSLFNGALVKVPLTAGRSTVSSNDREATMFYMDGKVLGLDLSAYLFDPMPTGSVGNTRTFDYLRLVMRRES